MEYPFGKYLIEMLIYTFYNHFGWSINNDALVVLSSTPNFFVVVENHERMSTIE
jgi:hypothetical protein